MTNLIRFLFGIFLIFCLLFFAPFESAAQTSELNSDPQRQIEIWQAQADEIEKDLQAILSSDKQAEPNQMGLYIEPLKQHIREADELIGIQNSFITPLQDQLNALGEKPADDQQEEPRIARERERITQEIQKYQSLQKQADVYKTRAFKMLETINRIEREAFAQKLIYRSVSITDPDVFKNAYNALLSFDINLETLKASEYTPYYAIILCVVLISYLIAWNARRHLLKLINQRYSDTGLITHAQRLKYMLSLAALRAFPFFFAIGLLYGTFTYLEQTDDLWFRTTLIGIVVTATMYILAYLYFAPYARPLRISLLDDIPAIKTARHFSVLGIIIGLDIIVVGFLWAHTTTQDNQALLLCVATVFRILEATALWRFTRTVKRGLYGKKPALISTASDYIRDDKHSMYHTVVRIGIKISVLVSLTTPVLVMAGYIKLSQFILFRSVGTGITLAIGFAFYKIIREFLTVIKGKPLSEEKTRQQAENSIQLVSVLVSAVLLMLAVPVMSLLWGGSIEDISLGWTALTNGFSIAGTRFSPADIFTFFIIFFIGYVLTRIVQNLLKRSVLPYTRLDVGASNSIVSGIGYFGIILALVIAISATGTDLSNLAIIAGALSVGVGFGLQAIVNNFVSGIILLVERPIKIGDWVVISNQIEGYVRKINVRATLIETFDRSTVIVPNSELISNSVTNWTHSDTIGRVIIPVGVAYDCDPRHVESVLSKVANNLDLALKRPAPVILFMGFGESSMDFEIRLFIRDINNKLYVLSEANFAIAQAFKEENIEIPFPHRDIYLKNFGNLSEVVKPEVKTDTDM